MNRYTSRRLKTIRDSQAGLLWSDPANINAGEVIGLVVRIEQLQGFLAARKPKIYGLKITHAWIGESNGTNV
jgi:hypothetical protein